MATQVELLYVLEKHRYSDRFDSELLYRISVQDEVDFLVPAQMEAASQYAVMGVMQKDTSSIMYFVRHAETGVPDLPVSRIRKVRFRILTQGSVNGQEHEAAFSYEIVKPRWEIIPGGPLPGHNWVALVSREGQNFRLQLRKPGGGSGGDDPCAGLNCTNPPDWISYIKCWRNDCI